jgi:AspT/YidE/YbjL antiporter-like protein
MAWLSELFVRDATFNTLMVLAAVIALGAAFGKLKVAGISFGVGGVMFAGLLFGHFKLGTASGDVLHFVREFGLILFVYTIGIEIGPVFFASFRRHGLRLNLLAATLVLLGFGCAAGIWLATGMHIAAIAGIMSGAVTNTPGLAAAQQALGQLFPGQAEILELPALAYAITYPFGILGLILAMILARRFFRINPAQAQPPFEPQARETVLPPIANGLTTDASGTRGKQPAHAGIAPIFLGIVMGLFAGAIPIPIPGMPTPLRLGVAGGPLLVALVLGRIRRIGPINWEMHPGTNHTIRAIGISLFLAVVGLNAGGRFVETLTSGDGWRWMAAGALITLVPPAIVITLARLRFKESYLSICGLTAGAMTDPPALAFAIQTGGSNAPALVFATVYATAMFLRILCAQLLVVLFAR